MARESSRGARQRSPRFVVERHAAAGARARAAAAVLDTIGVDAGRRGRAGRAHRPARRVDAAADAAVRRAGAPALRASAPDAALANGTAAHALDFDDMCFVSLAHPSAPLVPAVTRGRRSWPARPAARCSTPTSSASRVEARLGRADESAALSARLALHVDARHDRRRGRREPAARARRGRRPRTRWRSPRPKHPASRKTSARW